MVLGGGMIERLRLAPRDCEENLALALRKHTFIPERLDKQLVKVRSRILLSRNDNKQAASIARRYTMYIDNIQHESRHQASFFTAKSEASWFRVVFEWWELGSHAPAFLFSPSCVRTGGSSRNRTLSNKLGLMRYLLRTDRHKPRARIKF